MEEDEEHANVEFDEETGEGDIKDTTTDVSAALEAGEFAEEDKEEETESSSGDTIAGTAFHQHPFLVDTKNEALGASTDKEEFDGSENVLEEIARDEEETVDWILLNLVEYTVILAPWNFCLWIRENYRQ